MMIIKEYIKMVQIPCLDVWSMHLSEPVLHRLIEAIQATCFGILIGLFHKLISVQDIGHMLHLHVAQQLPSLKQSSCTSDLSPLPVQ